MSTNANVKTADSSHWYYPDARACYELPKKDGSGMKSPTLADARKLNLLCGVTGILRILDKPALTAWKIEQAVNAVLTTPRTDGEELDAFVYRVLHSEKVQDEEGLKARDLGTDVHQALEDACNGRQIDETLRVYVQPVLDFVKSRGKVVATELIVVGDGYAGKIDLILETPKGVEIWDFKTTSSVPKANKSGEVTAWPEHRLQNAAYAMAYKDASVSKTGNIYISTKEPGVIAIAEHADWHTTYEQGFLPVLQVWQFLNQYKPVQ